MEVQKPPFYWIIFVLAAIIGIVFFRVILDEIIYPLFNGTITPLTWIVLFIGLLVSAAYGLSRLAKKEDKTKNLDKKKLNLGLQLFIGTLALGMGGNALSWFSDLPNILRVAEVVGGFLGIVIVILHALYYWGVIIFAYFAFKKIQTLESNGIRVAMLSMLIIPISSIITYFVSSDLFFAQNFVATLIYLLIWFPYLTFAKKVKERFPPANRTWESQHLIAFALIVLSLPAMAFIVNHAPIDDSTVATPTTYAECIDLYGTEACHDAYYDECMTAVNDTTHCEAFTSCLDTYLDSNYCVDQYFVNET